MGNEQVGQSSSLNVAGKDQPAKSTAKDDSTDSTAIENAKTGGSTKNEEDTTKASGDEAGAKSEEGAIDQKLADKDNVKDTDDLQKDD